MSETEAQAASPMRMGWCAWTNVPELNKSLKDTVEAGAILELFPAVKENEAIAREGSLILRQYPFPSF